MDWIGLVGGLVGVASFVLSLLEWRKVNKKIAMLHQSGKAAEILPAWYAQRMMDDEWLFGLVTSDGRMIAITSISAVSDDGQWMDVELAERIQVEGLENRYGTVICAVAPDRASASVQINAIVAAIELQTS